MKAKGKTGFLMAIWAGASFAGYNIGSGYATGVETMQFYVPWGKELAFVGIIFSMLFAIAMLIPLYMAGRENSMGESEIYEYFCGKKMGKFFEIYIYVNMLVIIFGMMSGSGATLNQYFGVPEFVGAIFMGAVSVVASLLNLEKLMKVLSYIGIVAISLILISTIYLISTQGFQITTTTEQIESYVASGDLLKIKIFGVYNPILCMMASAGMVVISAAPWVVSTGALCRSKKEAVASGILSGAFYYLTQIVLLVFLFMTMDYAVYSEVPVLAAIQHYIPALSLVFSCVIILSIFSTLTGRLFVFASTVSKGVKSRRIAISILIIVVAVTVGSFVSFSALANLMFTITGTVGILLAVFIFTKEIRKRITKYHN